MLIRGKWGLLALLAFIFFALPNATFAQDALDTGDTAWILISTGLVLFMMIPGLAMFYAGLVRTRNVLSVFMHCFGIAALITVLWTIFGYSLAFTASNPFIGNLSKSFLSGVTVDSLSGTIPELLFFVFQMTFAIITPGLFVGAFAERMKFSAVLWFSGLWCVLVYLPITHMVWGEGGYFGAMGVFDFAGGIVVHITAGAAALVAAILVGKRTGYPEQPMPPHNMTMNLVGTAMLWVGWFGFNGGSALAANGQAAMAVVVTQISPSVAALTWIFIEWIKNGKPSALGFATGAIAGLAAITPASGTVGPLGAFAIGLCSGVVAYWAATWLKRTCGYDDALDVVGVHGFGGLVGILLVSFFASTTLGGTVEGLNMGKQFGIQAFAAVAAAVYTLIVSFIILKVIDLVSGLRVDEETEADGLDVSEHGETGYDL
ncbi:MAG: ammonium transporter [Gemmatimonadetes bacterium]|nr:ammonium transporter [Gemmatimonadota bacterium]MXY83607.1 ammonium transporter [Gemmatimonadota bacterium]MYB71649.1 ammonium transporter [Gemmatimonadota bacterium]